MPDLTRAQWRKSSRSSGSGQACVEVADVPRVVAIRDSKDRSGPVLMFRKAAFGDLLSRVRRGDLNL